MNKVRKIGGALAVRIWRLRPWMAYGVMVLVVVLVLMNLVSDALVTRYERTAARDPGTPYLQGMAPRDLGPEDAARAVLFVHGFIGAQSNFHDLPDQVAAQGWRVRTMRLPGHGTSPRDFERTTADELVAGVADELRALKARYPQVVLVGHSMGGALATLVAAEIPVDGLVLCAPFFDLTYHRILGIPTSGLATSLATVVRWLPGRPGGGPVNKKENRKYIDYYRWIPMQGCLAALEVRRRAAAPTLCAQITAPLLLIHSKNDRVTSSAASEAIAPAFSSEKKEIVWLEKSDHVIFWDYDEATVTESVLDFLEEVERHDYD